MIEKKVKFGNLFDFYGQLLTEKQQNILQMYFWEDLSLGEIGDILDVSRQAIYDVVKRSEKTLDGYEEKLELFSKFNHQEKVFKRIIEIIDKEEDREHNDVLLKIKSIIDELVE